MCWNIFSSSAALLFHVLYGIFWEVLKYIWMYWTIINFCMSILYIATRLNEIQIFYVEDPIICECWQFCSFIPPISFSYIGALSRNSILCRRDDREICSDLKEDHSSILPSRIFVENIAHQGKEVLFYSYFALSFFFFKLLIFIIFSTLIEMNMFIFLLWPINEINYFNRFLNVKPFLRYWDKFCFCCDIYYIYI